MSISDLHPQPSPAAVLADVVATVRGLDATWWTHQTDHDLVATVELVEQARSALAAVQAGAVAEADTRDLGKTKLAYGSTGDWLTHLGGLRKGEGRRIVARAHALTGPLAATRDAMTAGTVSPEQADVIVRSIDLLPSGTAVRARGEATLVEHAKCFDATDLARTGRHLVHVVDPDATDRKLERLLDRAERASHHSRYLSIVGDGAGGVRLKGRGSAEDGALLKAALLPLTAPAPAVDDHHGHDGHVSWCRTRAMPVPDCGTPSCRPPNTGWTATCHPTPTAHPPASWSPPPSTPCATASGPAWPTTL